MPRCVECRESVIASETSIYKGRYYCPRHKPFTATMRPGPETHQKRVVTIIQSINKAGLDEIQERMNSGTVMSFMTPKELTKNSAKKEGL